LNEAVTTDRGRTTIGGTGWPTTERVTIVTRLGVTVVAFLALLDKAVPALGDEDADAGIAFPGQSDGWSDGFVAAQAADKQCGC